jgi:hypothetical protein
MIGSALAGAVEIEECAAAAGARTGSTAGEATAGAPSSTARNREATKGSRVRRIAAFTSTPDNLSMSVHTRITGIRFVIQIACDRWSRRRNPDESD